MLTVLQPNACACDGKTCDWYSHVHRGAECETAFCTAQPPLGWQLRSDGRAICPACVVIAALREEGP